MAESSADRPRPLLRALLLLLCVGGFATGLQLTREHTPPDFETYRARLDRPAVQFISIRHEKVDIRLGKLGADWWILEPVELPADQTLVDELLDAWTIDWETVAVAVATPSRALTRELGLLDRRIDVQFESSKETLVRVEVGRALDDGNHLVRVGGGRTIYEALVPGRGLMSPHVEDWLDPSLVAFAPDQLTHLEVRAGDVRGEVTYRYHQVRFLHDGVELDVAQTPSWLDAAHTRFAALDLSVASDEQIAQHAASLASPSMVVLATTERRGVFRLDVGAPVTSGEGVRIARVERNPTFYVLSELGVRELLAFVPGGPVGEGPAQPPPGPPLTKRSLFRP